MTELDKKEEIAEQCWSMYRDGCQYSVYWEMDWETLVARTNDEIGQRYVEDCRKSANQILSLKVSGIAIKDLLKLLEEGKLYEEDDDRSLPSRDYAYNIPISIRHYNEVCDRYEQVMLQSRFRRMKKVGGE